MSAAINKTCIDTAFAVSRLKAMLTYLLAGGMIPFIRKYSTICP